MPPSKEALAVVSSLWIDEVVLLFRLAQPFLSLVQHGPLGSMHSAHKSRRVVYQTLEWVCPGH